MAPLLLLLLSVASARPTSWFAEGLDAARLEGERVDVALLRGPTTGYRPAVMARLPVGEETRPQLVVVDLTSGHHRVDPPTVRALGLEPTVDEEGAYLELETVALGGLTLRGLRVAVDEGADGFVLGAMALPPLAVALLPSAGVVRFVEVGDARALLDEVGPAVKGQRDGLALRLPGAIRLGERVLEGTFELRTDRFASRLAPSEELPSPVRRGGEPSHDAGARLGEVWLADTWMAVDPALPLAEGVAGVLGEDVLFAADLAVDPRRGLLAVRAAAPRPGPPTTLLTVEAARERYAQEERRAKGTPNATGAPMESRATIGFDGPTSTGAVLGDPGNPIVRDRNLQLADTLWAAGELEEALPRYLSAAQYAGDHCGAHLRLAVRRMATAGTDRLDKDFVARLVEDPLAQAALAWEEWSRVGEPARERLRAGDPPPPGTLAMAQPEECAVVWGLLHRVASSRGLAEVVRRIERTHPSDPVVAWARVLDHLDAGRYGPAASLLSVARKGATEQELLLAEIRAAGGQGAVARVEALAREVPGAAAEHPLISALVVLEAARVTRRAEAPVRRLTLVDPRWVPGQVALSLVTGEAPPPWDPVLEQRRPGDPGVACLKAAHLAVSGDPTGAAALLEKGRSPAVPDWWAARALVAHVAGDEAARDAALRELATRFPLSPAGRLGLWGAPTP